ncbi:hypothetical protein A4G20_05200 [Pasteurellaceae bacterium RH1A]|nr:hypothetical protein A4G20_05200 [Pasteurellaceae bacterium RH1A]
MNIKKETKYGNYHLMIDEDGKVHIKVAEGKVRPFLREVFEKEGLEYDEKKSTTREMGNQLIHFVNNPTMESPKSMSNANSTNNAAVRKSLSFPSHIEAIDNDLEEHQYTVELLENGTVNIIPKNELIPLYLIANNFYNKENDQVEFNYDKSWDKKQLGAALIDFIQQHDPESVLRSEGKRTALFYGSREESETIKYRIEQLDDGSINVIPESNIAILSLLLDWWNDFRSNWIDYEKDWTEEELASHFIDEVGKPEKDWNWWVNLPQDWKFSLLYLYHDQLEEEYEYDEDGILEVYYNEELQNDRNGAAWYTISEFILDADAADDNIYMTEPFESEQQSLLDMDFSLDFSPLAYIPNLKEISFYRADSLYVVPRGLDKSPNLEVLNFARSGLGEDDKEQNIEDIFAMAKGLPNLRRLDLSGTVLAYHFEDNQDELAKLQALMPNCEIEL